MNSSSMGMMPVSGELVTKELGNGDVVGQCLMDVCARCCDAEVVLCLCDGNYWRTLGVLTLLEVI